MSDLTKTMQLGLGQTVLILRTRLRWTQAQLAKEITKHAARLDMTITPDQVTVSRWEQEEKAPSPAHRMVLAKIAEKNGYEDLAEVFRASPTTWKVVRRTVELGLRLQQ